MIIEKDIFQLTVGSYVVGISKQKGRYKIKNPGFVRDFKSIEFLIHQGVLRVSVDTSKQLKADIDERITASALFNEPENDAKNLAENSAVLRKTVKTESSKPLNIERSFSERLVSAKKTFDEAKQIQAKILKDIKNGQTIDTTPIAAITSESIDIIFENPDALACVINIRTKDQYLLEHSVSVSILMSVFAKFLEFNKTLTQQLAIGAFLHDVGKILVPEEILNKPAKLTEAEFEIIKTHVVHSKKIVSDVKDLTEISRSIVANHHEKLDGQGYPLGIKGEQLSQYDKMISICDIFDALSADRVYKQGMAQIRAFAILRSMATSGHLDISLVDQFIKCIGVYPVGSLVKLSSNRLAIVDSRNPDNPTKPKVKAFYSLQQNVFTAAKEIDLSVSSNEMIEQGVSANDFDLDMNKIIEFLLMQG